MPDRTDDSRHVHPVGHWQREEFAAARRSYPHRHRYAELCCKSNFSFLRGASHPEELVQRAAELGYTALAITDRNTLAGVVRAHCAAKACNLKLIVGAELTPIDALPVTLYACDRTSYGRLARIITQGRRRAVKGSCSLTFDDIAQWSGGLIAAVHAGAGAMPETSVERHDPGIVFAETSTSLKAEDPAVYCEQAVRVYRDVFGDRLYLPVRVHGGADDGRYLAEINNLARATGIPMVATNDVHYHEPRRRFLQDVLTCIREHCTLDTAGRRLFANAERNLKTVDEMGRLFADYPQALVRTGEVADRCTFTLDELRYEYPEAICPKGRSPSEYLAELTWAGAQDRYPDGIPPKVRALIRHELELIQQLGYEPYFLTVHDIVEFARSRKILCQGRGSAANSAVCYCLGVTAVDPGRIDVLFERFVSAERDEPPDIDVDFEHERREEVFQYIYGKYGRDHAGIVAEVITYRPRSAIRDVGKVLGLSLDRVGALAKKHEWWSKEAFEEETLREAGLDPADRTVRMLGKLVNQLIGFPRHLSQHVGGFVITRGPLCEMVPIENAAMPDRTFIEWDKDDIDALGILKIDCLSLGMLTAIRKCLGMINQRSAAIAAPLALHSIPSEDPAVYDMVCRADTVGVFQIESRAQMSMLPRLKPRCYYDLVIEVAIVRPGPIQGGMVHPYLRRRAGEEPVSYPCEPVREVLERTLGVPLFQEQAMRLAVVAAGFTPGEADRLRRAMGAWRRHGEIEQFRVKLIEGMRANGLAEEFAQRCFEQIAGFGEYGFPESHAASFALLVYVSAWLKRYHPAAFCAALLNSQPMGFYHPAQLVRDARAHGVTVLPVDVNSSGYDCRLEPSAFSRKVAQEPPPLPRGDRGGSVPTEKNLSRPLLGKEVGKRFRHVSENGSSIQCRTYDASGERERGRSRVKDEPDRWGRGGPAVRLGMRLVKGISRTQVAEIERAQRERPYTSVADLAQRSRAPRATLARLAAADALGSLGLDRREALWQVLALHAEPPMLDSAEPAEADPNLPDASLAETVFADYESMGISLNAHPMALLRDELNRGRVSQARVLHHARKGQRLSVAGLVLVRQRPGTAGGIVFGTLEDETGVANLIIRPQVYEKYRRVARGAVALVAEGTVERTGEVVHLQVTRLQDLSETLASLRSTSRDFH